MLGSMCHSIKLYIMGSQMYYLDDHGSETICNKNITFNILLIDVRSFTSQVFSDYI